MVYADGKNCPKWAIVVRTMSQVRVFFAGRLAARFGCKTAVIFALVICMCYNRDDKWDIFHKQLVNIKR